MKKYQKLGGRLAKGLLALALIFTAFIAAPTNTYAEEELPFYVVYYTLDDAVYWQHDSAERLFVNFKYYDGFGHVNTSVPITMQWYWSANNSTSDRSHGLETTSVTSVENGKIYETEHTPSTSTVGVRYYFVVAKYEELVLDSISGLTQGGVTAAKKSVPRETVSPTARIEVKARDSGGGNSGGNSGNNGSSTGNNNGGSSSGNNGGSTGDNGSGDYGDIQAIVDKIIGKKGEPAWALLNLILMGLGILAALAAIFKVIVTKHKRRIVSCVLAAVFGVAGVITFILTEDMDNPMIIVDFWTILQAVIACLCIAFAIKAFQSKKEKEDKKDDSDKKEDADKEEESEKKEDTDKKEDSTKKDKSGSKVKKGKKL